MGPLNKIDWRKVEFYSSVITTIILVICGLTAFLLSLQWKGYDRGYGQLSKLIIAFLRFKLDNSVTSGLFVSLAAIAKGVYIHTSLSVTESEIFDTV